MSKRFIDTSIWGKRWFREFPPKMKLFYFYLLTNCDHAGMYDVDLELAEFQIGMPVKQEDVDKYLKDHIEVIKEDKWFLRKFVDFQYGILNQNVKAHASVMKILDKYKCLETVSNSLNTVSSTVQDKDKDINIDKVKDKEKDMNPALLKVSEKQKKTIGYRRTMFLRKVSEFAEEYDKEMRIDFADYWTESGGNKMRFEKEKVFDVSKRLARWSKNNFNKKDETGKFKLDSTGNSFIGYCSKCRVSDFFNKWELQNIESRCCKVKIIPIREDK